MKPPDAQLAVAVLFLSVLAIVSLAYILHTTHELLVSWFNPVVTPSEVDGALWGNAHLPPKSLFAADLFACEMLVSAGGKLCTIGGAWELADRANQRFADDERIFTTTNSTEAWALLHYYNVSYVFTYPRSSFYGYGWKQPGLTPFQDSRHFTLAYSVNQTAIYSVNR